MTHTPAPVGPHLPGAWTAALLCGAASYLDAASIVSTANTLVLYQGPLGLGPGSIGTLAGTLTLMFATGALLGGRAADLWGRRRMFLVYLVVLGTAQLAVSLAVSAPLLYAAIPVMGLAIGAILPTSLAVLSDAVPEERRGRMVALSNLLWSAGIIVVIVVMALFSGIGAGCGRLLFGHLAAVSALLLVLWLTVGRGLGRPAAGAAGSGRPAAARPSLRELRAGAGTAALVTTALFYALQNLVANTLGQYSTYLYVDVAGADVVTASRLNLLTIPLTLGFGLVTLRVADAPSRWRWFVGGAAVTVLPLVAIAVAGVTLVTALLFSVLVTVGFAFAGETMYKVWSQELVPDSLRATAQGLTMSAARYVAAGFAMVTPALLAWSPRGFFAVLTVLTTVAMLVAWVWIRPLTDRARQARDAPVPVG